MRTYIAKRLLLVVPTLLGVASLVFLIMRVIPGDVALLILGGDAGAIDPKQLVAMRQQLGLDQPILIQFGHWLWGFSTTTVSIIENGAGSVAVSARPALPNTRSTSGNALSRLSITWSNCPVCVTDMPGSVVGM